MPDAVNNPRRPRFGLNHGWRFVRGSLSPRRFGRALEKGSFVDLPHCWNVQDTFQKGLSYYRGSGTYVRTFRPPGRDLAGEATRLLLSSEGFYGLAEIFLDRRKIARLDGQYLGFRLDLSHLLEPGQRHELAIRLSNRCPRWVLPGTSRPDFVLFGGLAGRIFLEAVPETHLVSENAQITAKDLLADRPLLQIRYPIATGIRDPRSLTLHATLEHASGSAQVAAQIPLDAHDRPDSSLEATAFDFKLDTKGAELWSPEQPRLHDLHLELRADDEVVDSSHHRLGLREARFDEDGFHLNGERYELQGFNRHESLPGFGNALPRWLHREDAQTFKEHGANLVRLSHYPQHPDFLDDCDELGLFVYAEIASWKTARGGRWRRSALRQMKAMILRDRNRPSTLFWGMGNEAQHLGTYRALASLVHELDPGRPATYAESHFYRGKRAGLIGLPDVWSCNYDVDSLDDQHRAARSGAVLVSECCNDQARRGELDEEVEQALRMLVLWRSLENKPYLAGYTLWSFADYPTLFRKRYTRFTGRFDCWRQSKLAAAVFKARHRSDLFVKVFGSWAREGESVRRLAIATNAATLELRSGEHSKSLTVDSWLVLCDVPYRPDRLSVTGERSGERFVDELYPWREASGLRLEAEAKSVSARTRDFVGLRIQVVDESGLRVGNWQGECRLESEGPALRMTYSESDQVAISSGTGRTFVRSTGQPGAVRLRVVADGLKAAEIEIEFGDEPVAGLPDEI